MPQYRPLTLPSTAALRLPPDEEGSAWIRLGLDRYFAARYHFALTNAGDEPSGLVCGDPIIAELSAPVGSETTRTIREEVEVETCLWLESLSQIVINSEVCQQIASAISGKIGVPISQLQSELRTQVQTRFASSLTDSQTIHQGFTARRTVLAETSHKVTSGRKYVVSSWRRRSIDAYLTMVDFLEVTYRARGLQVRPRRQKNPPLPDNITTYPRRQWYRGQPNVILFKEPAFRAQYWELVPQSFPLRSVEEYVNEVPDPAALEILDPTSTPPLTYTPAVEDVPTLYELANIFPPKRWW